MRNSSLATLALLAACSSAPPAAVRPVEGLVAAESAYADLREARDRYDVTSAGRLVTTPDSVSLDALALHHDELRTRVAARLASIDSAALAPDDGRALGIMRLALEKDVQPLAATGTPTVASSNARPSCTYDPAAVAHGRSGIDSLRKRIYDCYGWAQQHVVADGDTLDRLSTLGAIPRTADSAERKRLFLALDPVWRSINDRNGTDSPYRTLIALVVRHRGAGETPAARQARASGVPPDSLEGWLYAILGAWRDATPDSLAEPWDWLYAAGAASRALSPTISLERLQRLNAEVYEALGADVADLRVHYDLAPRVGKDPVAYTTFGKRARLRGGQWTPGEPWVFATYREGGLDNLAELLHETGHAIHIAAIHTRPAFADWPDSDPFSEALGEFVALDIAEPAWQRRWLGDTVPLADGLRARYAGIVMDVAWALLEARMLKDPGGDPNEIWTQLTRDYLHIRPHPELSWWAMRGQLVDVPGYMMNYAAGAILIAAIRARTIELHGTFAAGDSTWYPWVAARLFRFGLERPTSEVVEEFLGGPVTPAAILRDMRRMTDR